MAEYMNTYTIKYERDDTGWWVATVKGVRGCHTQGRTIDQARQRIHEALELFVDDVAGAEFVDDIKLPAKIRASLTNLENARRRADEEAVRLGECTFETAKLLASDLGLSLRDIGKLMGLSHQRIQQLLSK